MFSPHKCKENGCMDERMIERDMGGLRRSNSEDIDKNISFG